MRELDVHKMLSHRHLIRLHEIIDDEGDDKVYLIVEYAERGQIMDYDEDTGKFFTEDDKPFSEEEIARYCRQLVSGLVYLHGKKIVHFDLKPQNILLDSVNNVKIADFGSAQIFYDEEDTFLSHKGTFEFLAPECHKAGMHAKYYSGRKADVWALGLCVFALCFG